MSVLSHHAYFILETSPGELPTAQLTRATRCRLCGRCPLIAWLFRNSLPVPSSRLTIVIVQHSAQARAALNGCSAVSNKRFLNNQPVAQSLVVALVI